MLAELQEKLDALTAQAAGALDACSSLDELQQTRAQWLGKSGAITGLMRQMKDLSHEERPQFGQAVNRAKEEVTRLADARRSAIEATIREARLNAARTDLTLPGRRVPAGALHPLRRVEADLLQIFAELGYDVAYGPEVETDFHNFEALNFPPDHPARDMQDTFVVEGPGSMLLRTHTSSVQIRTMLANKLPVRIVAPGAVYRCDEVDMTHHPMFHQLECLCVDEGITMAHLKATLEAFAAKLFGRALPLRLRPSFFPFTEPSAEVDVECIFCGGDGCRVCSHTGWIEVLGAGMVHPEVFRACGLDPDRVQGFAFGMGIDRLTMLRYGISDIRMLYDNEQRFLAQFA